MWVIRSILLLSLLSVALSGNPKVIVRTPDDVKNSLENNLPLKNLPGNIGDDHKIGMAGIPGRNDDDGQFPSLPDRPGDGGDGGDGDGEDDDVIEFVPFVLSTKLLNKGNTTGKIMTSHQGRDIYSFQGIQYTQSPRRFQKTISPMAQDDYPKELDATRLGKKCLQASKFNIKGNPIPTGDEDCFFLNVYTPIDPSKEKDLLPVMVFIHGGQFVSGDASSYLPIRLLDEDVLLVTFHYRLGALSFYSHGKDGTYPGNLALYDQTVALKWVNKYIEDFGGDKDKVTLVGQDAGAISALYLLLAGKSVDVDEDGKDITLFTAVIAQSGSPIDPFALDQDGDQTSLDLETLLGCDKGTTDDRAICMINVPATEIALGADKLAESQNRGFSMMAPRIEVAQGIVVKSPLELLSEGNYEKLPLLLGTCAQEGSFIFGAFYSYYLESKVNDGEYLEHNMVPDMVELAGIVDPLEFVSASLYETYLKGVDRTIFDDTVSGMIDMTGALFSKSGILETAKLSYDNYFTGGITGGDKKVADIFLYSFEYKGEDSSFPYLFWSVEPKPDFTPEQIGVTHGDDLLYLLKMSSLTNKDDEDTMLSMTKMWAQFATEHNPTPTGVGSGVQWKSYSNQNQEYLSIGKTLEAKENYEERYTILVDDDEGDTPDFPNFPGFPDLPNRPDIPDLPEIPDLPDIPDFPEIPDLPNLPNLPDFGGNSSETTTSPTTTDPDLNCSCNELSEIDDERVAYMITMIVFIILFVIVLGFAMYSYSKSR